MKPRLKILGVMGSGSRAYPEFSRPVGRLAAKLGYHLLTGGGDGVMAEAARVFYETLPRRGLNIGIIKGEAGRDNQDGKTHTTYEPSGPNEWVEIPIFTHLPLSGVHGQENGSRNHINVLSSDILVALPGDAGTYSEVLLCLGYGRKLVLFIGSKAIAGHSSEEIAALAGFEGQVGMARSPDELESLLAREAVEIS